MRKFGLIIAALGAFVIAAPSIVSAETVVIKRGGHHSHSYKHGHNARAQIHHDRRWHRGARHGHRDRVIVIKKRYHRY
jgi:hypothetical protein